MGDIVRQMLYPLVVPAIVACVWIHAWAMKQEPEYVPARSPAAVELADFASTPAGLPAPAAGYGLASVEHAEVED